MAYDDPHSQLWQDEQDRKYGVTRDQINQARSARDSATSEQDRMLKALKAQYLDARRRGDWDAAAGFQDKYKQQQGFNSNLARYDEDSQKFADKTRQGFRHFADVEQGRQQGGLARGMNMALSRRGLQDSGIGAAMMTGASTELAGRTMEKVAGFESDLASLQYTNRDAFVKGEFDYMNRLNMMRYQTDLEKDLQAFSMQLQVDANKRSWFGEVLNFGGQALMAYLNPVAAIAPVINQYYGQQQQEQQQPSGGSPNYQYRG